MSDRKWTPGPWLVDGRTVYALNYKGVNRFSCAVEPVFDEAFKNAQLIAAALDLYDALAAFVAMESHIKDGISSVIDNGRAALAKARGEE